MNALFERNVDGQRGF
jgi:hypothetical protein